VLLVPILRRPLIRAVLGRVHMVRRPGSKETTTIEGEFRREDDPRLR
jgi:hypothetical protein